MARFRLNTVLELRRQQERAAESRLADAMRAREDAQRQEQRLVDDESRAQTRLAPVNVESLARVADLQAAERFSSRRRQELAEARMALQEFRSGPLASAEQAEEEARRLHAAARQAREMLDRQLARHQAAEHAARERRADDELADATDAHWANGRPK